MLKITNKSDMAEIVISGSIVDDDEGGAISDYGMSAEGYNWPADIKAKIDAIKGKPLTIYINSYGGSVAAGCAMSNMIKRHDAPTTAIVDGVCCSIATQIFFAADSCKMPSNAYLMVHKPSAVCRGDADDMLKTAEILDTMQEGLETTYQSKAIDGVTNEQIHEMVDNETWLTGSDAAKIFNIELLEPLKAVACAGSAEKFKGCKSIPKDLRFKAEAGKSPDANINERVEIALAIAKGATAI